MSQELVISAVGEVMWLTPEQGGQATGVPDLPHLAAAGFVPPQTVETGLASFALLALLTE